MLTALSGETILASDWSILMLLSFDWTILILQNVRKLSDSKIDSSFHLIPALENGDFHDFVIRSRSGKEFPVHKTILSAEKINTDERYLETVFFGFSDEVTRTLLHFIYSQSLPENLSPATASQVILASHWSILLILSSYWSIVLILPSFLLVNSLNTLFSLVR